MKKRSIFVLLTALICLVCLLLLSSCGEAVSITGAEVNEDGDLIITFSDGSTQNAGKVKGEDGKDGATDGENPQGLDFYPLPDGTWAVSAGKAIYLEEVTIPATYKGKAVTCIGGPEGFDSDVGGRGFADAINLKKITIPDSVTYIGECAFDHCDSLTTVTFGANSQLTSIGKYAFESCSSLTSITIPNSVTDIGRSAFYNCSSLTSITIPNSVTSIGSSAFESCSSLTSITIPNSIISIDEAAFSGLPESAYTVYQNGKYLGNDQNPYLYLVGVIDKSIGAFEIPQSTKFIGSSAFPGYTSLTSITIPSSVTSIGNYAFQGCSSLTSITLSEGVTRIGYEAFVWCDSLTSITIPSSVTNIGNQVFLGCHSLESIIVANGNPVYHSAGNCLVETASKTLIVGCKNSVIPTDGSVTSIGDNAFSGCSSLTSITIPDSVTSIGSSAFSGCISLTSITIPSSVTSIGDWAFSGCNSLTSINYRGSEAQWNAISKGNYWNNYTGNYTIHYNYTEA